MTLWENRFGEQPADALMAFTASIEFDRRLAVDDLAGSRAHVRGLLRAGVLTEQELGILLAALNRVEVHQRRERGRALGDRSVLPHGELADRPGTRL